MNRVSSEESERQQRLGYTSCQKVVHAHSAQLETDKDTGKPPDCKTKNKNKEIEELSSKVDALTRMVEALTATKTAEQPCQCAHTQPRHRQTAKRYGCPKCIENGTDSCNHCFICVDEGHRAAGCLKRWQAKNSSQPSADVNALSNSEWQCTTKIELQMENQTDVQTNCVTCPLTNQGPETQVKVARLVGRKCKIKCYINSYKVDCIIHRCPSEHPRFPVGKDLPP